jgi:hypothetical protein
MNASPHGVMAMTSTSSAFAEFLVDEEIGYSSRETPPSKKVWGKFSPSEYAAWEGRGFPKNTHA